MEIKPTFSDDRSEKLEHYGVKGMKWGKRKLVDKVSDEVRDQAGVIYDESGIDRTKSRAYNDRVVAKNAKKNAREFVSARKTNGKSSLVSSTGRLVTGTTTDAKASKAGSAKASKRRSTGAKKIKALFKRGK